MARAGFLLNIAGIILITAITYAALPILFGVELGRIPEWAVGR
jgi:hypothetical protein